MPLRRQRFGKGEQIKEPSECSQKQALVKRDPRELIGYTDKLSVIPLQSIDFKVSTSLDEYDLTLVLLIHRDKNPSSPDFKE